MGRPKKGEAPKVWKNITMEDKAADLLGTVGMALTERLGFRPSHSQTILFLIKHYERTEKQGGY